MCKSPRKLNEMWSEFERMMHIFGSSLAWHKYVTDMSWLSRSRVQRSDFLFHISLPQHLHQIFGIDSLWIYLNGVAETTVLWSYMVILYSTSWDIQLITVRSLCRRQPFLPTTIYTLHPLAYRIYAIMLSGLPTPDKKICLKCEVPAPEGRLHPRCQRCTSEYWATDEINTNSILWLGRIVPYCSTAWWVHVTVCVVRYRSSFSHPA